MSKAEVLKREKVLKGRSREKKLLLISGNPSKQGLLYSEELETFSDARRREARVNRWSRGQREALASGDLKTLHQLAKRPKP